jgi:excisionase family DNA binding protein
VTEPVLMPVRDFAKAEGLGRDATYRLVAEGRIRAVRVNRKILIPRSELAAFPEREMGGARGD